MAQEPAHVELLEFKKENITYMNWMFEDLFCLYGTSIPYFLLDFEFPSYAQVPDEFTGYEFNLDWGPWGQWLVWFNELLGLLFDEAHLPRWQMPDFSDASWSMFNDYITSVYDNIQRHDWYNQSGTFTKDEVVEGEDSGITGYYKWTDGDDHIYIATKQDSGGVAVADYDDEKVTGQTSGAYAYTYVFSTEVFWLGAVRPNRLRRYSGELASAAAAWDDYDNDPTNTTITDVQWNACFGCQTIGSDYRADGFQSFLKFRTSGATANPSSAIISFSAQVKNDTGLADQTFRIYEHDYGDAVDVGDWTGGYSHS